MQRSTTCINYSSSKAEGQKVHQGATNGHWILIFLQDKLSIEYQMNSIYSSQHTDSSPTNDSVLSFASSSSCPTFDNCCTKAIFLDTSIPLVYQKHHVRLYSAHGDFSTILKEDERITVQEVVELLRKKFHFPECTIVLHEEGEGNKVLHGYDKLVEIQNDLFREMWIDECELPTAALKYQGSFKFMINTFRFP